MFQNDDGKYLKPRVPGAVPERAGLPDCTSVRNDTPWWAPLFTCWDCGESIQVLTVDLSQHRLNVPRFRPQTGSNRLLSVLLRLVYSTTVPKCGIWALFTLYCQEFITWLYSYRWTQTYFWLVTVSTWKMLAFYWPAFSVIKAMWSGTRNSSSNWAVPESSYLVLISPWK